MSSTNSAAGTAASDLTLAVASHPSGTGSPSAEVSRAPCAARAARPAVGVAADTPTPAGDGVLFACSACGAEKTARRLPPGWKRDGEHTTCATCWKTRYVLRAVSIPVRADESLWKTMRAGWQASRRFANWYVRHLYLSDDFGAFAADKLPRYPRDAARAKRLYDASRAYAPDFTTVSSSALMHWCEQSYMRRRFEVWIGKSSLPTFRGVPWMVRRTGWTPAADGGAVTATLYGERRALALSASADFAPQRALLVRAAAGELLRGDLKLCEDGKCIMLRAAVWVPVVAARPANGTLCVSTAEDALLTFTASGQRVIRPLRMDHLRRWIVAHDEWRQAMANDTKYEKRWPSHVRRDMLAALERRCRRANNRIATACKQIAAMIVGHAARRRFSRIELSLVDRGFLPRFPWSQLRGNIVSAAELRGIGCVEPESVV